MLELIDIHKSYEGQPLLRGISFEISARETVCLLGASGSGKSTMLRIIAGLEQAEQGRVCWDGRDLSAIPAHRRNFGLVFQDYALFPHLNVAENIAFGLRMQKVPQAIIQERLTELLEKIGLTDFGARPVAELSGGEQQRVALARALAPHPRLLMFDEPLGALDRTLKDDLLEKLRSILRESGVPAIYVTHDQEEAFAIADRILLLNNGQIIRSGTPAEVSMHPSSDWVARFLGAGNILDAKVSGMKNGKYQIQTALGSIEVLCTHVHQAGDKLKVMVPRRGVSVEPGGNFCGRVVDVAFRQDGYKVTLEDGSFFYFDEAPLVGQEICLSVPPPLVQCLS